MATSRKTSKHVNIVIPVFNEDKAFPKTFAAIQKYVKSDHDIFVVYDFDEDTTIPVVKKLQKNNEHIHLVKNNIGRGPLNALKSGFKAVKKGPLLVVMADLSDDLSDVDKMLELYNEGNNIVCGSRYLKGGKQIGGPLIKRTLSHLAGVSLYYIRRIPTHDVTNNFKLYDSQMLRKINIESTQGFCIAMEITVKGFLRGESIAELPTVWRDRTDGESNFKLWSWLPQYIKWYLFVFRRKNI